MARVMDRAGAAATDDRPIHKVPDPFPLTLAGMLAALGPQAINFGISIGGGEAYLLPNVSARGTLHMHWLMTISVVLETALVYECIKYSVCTGRSFFAATNDLKPFGFWPWFWAVVSIATFAWPAWMGGAVIAAHRFTGIGNPRILGLPPYYIWAVVALLAVLVVFYFSDRTYNFLSKFFTFIMFANIVLVLAVPSSRPSRSTTGRCGWDISASPSPSKATRRPCPRPTRWRSSTSPAAASCG